jgi:hypothetical protein
MAAVKTRTDWINQALNVLGILAAGQDPSAEDFTAVDKYIDPLVAELRERSVVDVDDTEEVPNHWFLPLSILLADACANEFGLAGVPAGPSNPDPVAKAEMRLREVQYSRPTGVRQGTEYF